MSEPRVIKAVFYRRGMQVGEMTGAFASGMSDAVIKMSMLETYRMMLRQQEEGAPIEDAEFAERDPELEAQLNEIFAAPEQTLNLADPTDEGGPKEYGNDG